MMDWLHSQLWQNGNFKWWEIVGWTGNAVFFSRFIVQWIATEKKKRVVVPMAFWWLSLVGSLLLLAYASLAQRNMVLSFAYAFAWIPYLRNLVIHRRHSAIQLECPKCHAECPPQSNFCFSCGNPLTQPQPKTGG